MIPTLRFEMKEMLCTELGEPSGTPDLLGSLILQNNLDFQLEEEDEIFEGYGTYPNSYPYKQYNRYCRTLYKKERKVAILENDFLLATFLPELGGRLWQLIDKKTGQNLLYTNDVIRYSNLAVRNAWFSGGVEWNLGVIGHTPLTTEPLFTAKLTDEQGCPILRMYEYERIRGVEYQMDFWLGQDDTSLNCRMRIVNSSKDVIPMYWWSNMAVPEHENGRIAVPASKAYTSTGGLVQKVDVPMVDGVDISHYDQIPKQVDYFFELQKNAPKYIANLDEHGYGLLHQSTDRLQSRKLFSWGNNDASLRWQEFLTQDAGRYLEIQAGLGKTQYGCIPMAPHTAWEWLEQYGPVQLEEGDVNLSMEELSQKITSLIFANQKTSSMEHTLHNTKKMAKMPAQLVYEGSGFGALKNEERTLAGMPGLSAHLDFGSCPKQQELLADFLKTGILYQPDPKNAPEIFPYGDLYLNRLTETIGKENKENWYAHYLLGLLYYTKGIYSHALCCLKESLNCQETSWANHAMAALYVVTHQTEEALAAIMTGLSMRSDDLSYVKEGFKIALLCGGETQLLSLYEQLPASIQEDSRIQFFRILCLYRTGHVNQAYDLLCKDGGLVVDDIREGEDSIGQLWIQMYQDLFKTEGDIPHQFNFLSL